MRKRMDARPSTSRKCPFPRLSLRHTRHNQPTKAAMPTLGSVEFQTQDEGELLVLEIGCT
jgi:hypothetical protein